LTQNAGVDRHPDWQPLTKFAGDANDVSVDVVETPLTVSAQEPKLVSFGSLFPGNAVYAMRAPVKVVSGHDGGYQLWVTRTPFAQPVDIPLGIRCAEAPPAGATCDLTAAGTGAASAIPTTNSIKLGHRSGATTSDGDVWQTDLVLGPIPPIAPGSYHSRVTYTAVGF
jgi:hypothetical protein